MHFSDKLIRLRKSNGMSQERLAERLNVSRQAVSRWEAGTAMPDANNMLRLSKLFGVTADYLLNDDCESEAALPKGKGAQGGDLGAIMVYMIVIEGMVLLIQFMTTVILQNGFFACLSLIPFLAVIGGFECGYRRSLPHAAERIKAFRRRFYKISAWLGLYFPIRFVMSAGARFYPRPYSAMLFEVMVLVFYMLAAVLVNLAIDKRNLPQNQA